MAPARISTEKKKFGKRYIPFLLKKKRKPFFLKNNLLLLPVGQMKPDLPLLAVEKLR